MRMKPCLLRGFGERADSVGDGRSTAGPQRVGKRRGGEGEEVTLWFAS